MIVGVNVKLLVCVALYCLLSCMICAEGVFDFVAEDIGYFLLLRNTESALQSLKQNTNFFGAYLGDSGFGAERSFYGIIDAAGYSAGVEMTLLKRSINREILLAGDEIDLKIGDLLTLDPFYFLERMKITGRKIYIVWSTQDSSELMKLVAAVLDMKVFTQKGDTIAELRGGGGVLFAYPADGFLIIGGTRDSIDSALNAYTGRKDRLIDSEGKGQEVARMSKDYWITGYFDSDRFNIDMGLETTYSIQNTTILVRPVENTLHAYIEQDILFMDDSERERLESMTNCKTLEVDERAFGDYMVFFPSSSLQTLRRELSRWFELDLQPYSHLADYIVDISAKSDGNVRIYGNLFSGDPDASVVFNMSEDNTFILEEKLLDIGGMRLPDEKGIPVYMLEDDFNTIYFLFEEGTIVCTILEPAIYLGTIERANPLSSNETYKLIMEKGWSEDIIRAYIDARNIFRSLIDLSVESGMLYQQRVDQDGKMIHTIRVF